MFPVTLTITIHSNEQLQALLAATNVMQRPAEPVKTAKAEAAPKAQDAAKAASSASGAAHQTTPPVESAPETAEQTHTIDDAKRLTTECVKAGKRAEIVELLKEFNVAQAVKLAPEQVGDFCAKAEALLK